MLQTRAIYPGRPYDSVDYSMFGLAARGGILLVLPDDHTEAMMVADRGARLAAALGRVPVVHVLPYANSTSNGDRLPPALISRLRAAAGEVTSEQIPIAIIDHTDVQTHIMDVVGLMQPKCIIASDTLVGTNGIKASSTRRWLIENCPVPLWLVSPYNDARQPIILAAIDTIGDHHATSSLARTVLRNASDLADLFAAKLHVCHSVSLGNLPQTIQMQLEPIRREAIERWLGENQINAHAVHVLFGRTDQRVRALADTLKPKLVVQGAAYRTIWDRIFTTNITRTMVESLDRDMLIVRSEASLLPKVDHGTRVLQ